MASLVSHITDLASAVASKFKSISPRLNPAGGTTGQALVKNSATDYDTKWTSLGTAASANTGASGHAVPFLDAANTWALPQTFQAAIVAANLSGTNTGDQTNIPGNAATATALATGRTLAITGDLSWTSPAFDGSTNITAAATLATTGVTAGTYGAQVGLTVPSLAIDAKGRITSASSYALGTAATASTGTSGHALGFLDAANTFSALQTMPALAVDQVSVKTINSTGLTLYAAYNDASPIINIGTAYDGSKIVYNVANKTVAPTNSTWTLGTSANSWGALYAASATFSGAISASNFTGSSSGTNTGDQTTITGNAGSATKLAAARTIASTGDVAWSTSFDGTGNATGTATLAASGVTAGTYGASNLTVPTVTLDAKGRVTSAGSYTLGTAAAQSIGTSGGAVPLLNQANTWSANQTINGLATINMSGANYASFNNGAANATPGLSIGGSGGKSLNLCAGTQGTAFVFDKTGTFAIVGDTKANIDGGAAGNGTVFLSVTGAGNASLTGTFSASNFSGSSSGTNTGDQTNIPGNAATATNVAWTGVTGKPTTIGGYGITDAPTLTGSGASGTWAINISGTAANATQASAVAWGNVTGKPFNYSGQGGQPSWLWGTNDGSIYYVWNPSNFNVNSATYHAGNPIGTSGTAVPLLSNANTWGANQYFTDVYASRSANSGVVYLGSNGGTYVYNDGTYVHVAGKPLYLDNGGLTANGTITNVAGSVQVNAPGNNGWGFTSYNSNGGTDAKYWRMYVSGSGSSNSLVFDCMNDAASTSSTWLTVSRSGQSPTGINLNAPVYLNATCMQFNGGSSGATVGYSCSTGVFLDGSNVGFRTYGSNGIYFQSAAGGNTYAYVNSGNFVFNVPINLSDGQWHLSADGVQRFLYNANGASFYNAQSDRHVFRTSQSDKFYINTDGTITQFGTAHYFNNNTNNYISNDGSWFRMSQNPLAMGAGYYFNGNGGNAIIHDGTTVYFQGASWFQPPGTMNIGYNLWHQSIEGVQRFYFGQGGRSYYNSNNGHEFRNGQGYIASINADGRMMLGSQTLYFNQNGGHYINNDGGTLRTPQALNVSAGITVNRGQRIYFAGQGDTNHSMGHGVDSFNGTTDGVSSWLWNHYALYAKQSNVLSFFMDGRGNGNGFNNCGYVGIYGITDPRSPLEVAGAITSIAVTGNNGNDTGGNFRAVGGNRAVMFRNDGANFYILFSDDQGSQSGARNASFNGYRPLRMSWDGNLHWNEEGGSDSFFGRNVTINGTASFGSDISLKETIETITGALDKVKAMRGVTYNLKADGSRSAGVIAQEHEKIAPELVTAREDGILTVNYNGNDAYLIEAIKELAARVEALEGS